MLTYLRSSNLGWWSATGKNCWRRKSWLWFASRKPTSKSMDS